MRVITVFGTRPEAIKMCPLILELRKHKDIESYVCLTGQHREMLMQVMEEFGIQEDFNLDIMTARQTLTQMTINILSGLDDVFEKMHPDLVLVHGDTTSSYAAALCAFYHQIPVGHVEAGLRTYNLSSPYPEEFNRQAVDLITQLYFAPTYYAKDNLIKEGKREEQIFVTGNTIIDALKTTIKADYTNEDIEWAKGSKLILMTAHRRENIGGPMENIFRAVRRIVDDNADVKVIYPMHKNPKIREIAFKYLTESDRIRMIEPLDVLDFHNYMNSSYLILTDSGGIQEEAPSLGVPVLVMRDTTERPEGIETGTLKLVGTEEENIYNEVTHLLLDRNAYKKMSNLSNPYGDGHASERIAEVICNYAKGINSSTCL